MASIFARIGGALAPVLDGALGNEFMYMFGGLSVICGVCTCFMRETKGAAMLDSNS